ncbi:ABC transporter ATP-binding protein [Paenibacillus sp. MAEPY2]|nr:ABC transporter ATP-binding protein [Paenibacillus sp. MAEPY2]
MATMLFTASFSIWIACLFVLGMLATALIVPGIVLLGQRKTQGRVRKQRAQLSTEVTEVLYGFRDLKVYGQMAQGEQKLQHISAALAAEQQRAAGNLLRGQSIHAFVTFLISWGVLALGGYLIMDGALAGVFLAMLVMASLTVFEEAAAMATLPVYKQDSEHAAKRLTETVVASATLSSQQPIGKVSTDHPASIELSGVTFQYEGEWRPALKEISLHFPAGSKTAIVGPSGSGKSTLIDLILKLRTPMAGDIRLNDVSMDELNETSLWEMANVVLQQNHFFRGTIRDNLLLSRGDHTDKHLLDVLAKVQLSRISLTDLVLEKGENLSEGEKQRIALARALLRQGRVWLLDEPTSSLDYVTEQRVMTHLYEQAAGDTLLLICHRLTGLEQMDRIVVMEQGRIVETGSYAELMMQQGYFYEMKQIERQMVGGGAET